MHDKPTVSIIVPVLNGTKTVHGLFRGLLQQSKMPEQVIILDSESTDDLDSLLEHWRRAGLPILKHLIPRKEFSHGGTRNLGATLASTEILVFMTQDAEPANSSWLEALVEPFENERVAFALSRHIPRKECDPITAIEIDGTFDRYRGTRYTILDRTRQPEDYKRFPELFWFNTDVCSAVRASVLAVVPFQNVPYAEDQRLGKDIVEAGYSKAVSFASVVIHSHQYSPLGLLRRHFDDNRGLRIAIGQARQVHGHLFLAALARESLSRVRRLASLKRSDLMFWFLWVVPYSLLCLSGTVLGYYFALMPAGLQRFFSSERKAYDRRGLKIQSDNRPTFL